MEHEPGYDEPMSDGLTQRKLDEAISSLKAKGYSVDNPMFPPPHPTKPMWEEEFDEKFVSTGVGLHPEREMWGAEPGKVKSFIRTLIAKEYEKALHEMSKTSGETSRREELPM